ncbi:maltase A3-like [Ischnura elegans]|uniref:maltase A3-like n=1 Tax=Ischnura elegans TaxID=197161 RepID=UPI001ED8B25C|nr:maltase A3-like [Ischnura elegans]
MCRLTIVLFLMAVAAASNGNQDWPAFEGELDWWQKAVFYQIYPRSFKDSDGDGISDLKGITDNLEHVYNLGAAAAWLSPIYKSPMKDFGYDIADYEAIDPIFGTMDDFLALVAKAKTLGLKIIMDFVPNHSSDQHEWFRKSVKRVDPYTNYYVWSDGKVDEDGNRKPPSNWISVFGGPAWQWNDERGQYYLHQFDPSQPDLNITNELVVDELLNVLDFWMDKGVGGFRIDAVNHMFEADGFPDEPRNNQSGVTDPNDYGYLDHIYTKDDPRCYGVIEKFRARVDAFAAKTDGVTRVLMTEAYTSIENAMKYFGTPEHPGSHMPFNFLLINNLGRSASNFANGIAQWMDNLPKKGWANWLVGNHDNHRVASRYAPELVDALNMIIMLLPGTGVSYYGEEIGMEDTFITWQQTQDPQGCNAGPDHYMEKSRDPERTPFQWSDAPFAGFTEGNSTWLPVNPNYVTLNVKAQELVTVSHINIYKQLVSVRETPTAQQGDLSVRTIGESLFAFTRNFPDEEGLLVVVNLGLEEMNHVNLQTVFDKLPEEATVKITSDFSKVIAGETVSTKDMTLLPNEGLVLGISSE